MGSGGLSEDDEVAVQTLLPLPSGSAAEGVQRRLARISTGGRSRPTVPTWRSPKLAAIVLLLGLSAVLYHRAFTQNNIETFFTLIKDSPGGSMAFVFVVFVLAVVLMLPAMYMAVGVGAAYGFTAGLLFAWAATVLGQTLAFLLGRFLLREHVAAFLVARIPNFATVEGAVKREGWKLVCLLRLSPIVPWNILNYIMAATAIDFQQFFVPSALTVLPWLSLSVYLGAGSSDVMAALQGSSTSYVGVVSMALSALLLSVVLLSVGLASRRAIQKVLQRPISGELSDLVVVKSEAEGGGGGGIVHAEGQERGVGGRVGYQDQQQQQRQEQQQQQRQQQQQHLRVDHGGDRETVVHKLPAQILRGQMSQPGSPASTPTKRMSCS